MPPSKTIGKLPKNRARPLLSNRRKRAATLGQPAARAQECPPVLHLCGSGLLSFFGTLRSAFSCVLAGRHRHYRSFHHRWRQPHSHTPTAAEHFWWLVGGEMGLAVLPASYRGLLITSTPACRSLYPPRKCRSHAEGRGARRHVYEDPIFYDR